MLTSIAIIAITGFFLGTLLEQVRLPRLLGYLFAGILLGPQGSNLIATSLISLSKDISQFALVIILLRAGLSLQPKALMNVGRPALLLCFVPALFEMFGMMLIAPTLLHISLLDAAIIGSVVAAVSPAVVVPRMLHLMEQGYGRRHAIPQMMMAGASVDDVVVIVIFTALIAMSKNSIGIATSISILPFLVIPLTILLGIGLGIVAGMLLAILFRHTNLGSVVEAIVNICISFLLLEVETITKTSLIPISGLLAVMAMGATLLQTVPKKAAAFSSQYGSIWVIAELFLFAFVGMNLDITYAMNAGIGGHCDSICLDDSDAWCGLQCHTYQSNAQ